MTLRIAQWTLAEIARALGGELTDATVADAHATAVSTDTRSLTPGALFVALRGENFDGHDHLASAFDAGACAAIVASPAPVTDGPKIVVRDTLRALQQLGRLVFDAVVASGATTIALTGSNGKTTTKELIAAVWGSEGARVHATAGNFNNHVGVPLTLCATPAEVDVLVVEMGANQFGDIEELIALAPAAVRCVTSIGYAHIEKLRSLEGVRRVKSELFKHADDAQLAVVPETERMMLWLNEFGASVATVGSAAQGGAVTYSVRNGRVALRGPNLSYDLAFPLPGTHNLHNLATAVATLLCGDFRPSNAAVQAALDAFQLPGGRWRRVARGAWTVLDDAYNANPSSVRASWDAFVEIASLDGAVDRSMVLAVLGEMYELGEDAEQLHRETATWVAERGGAGTFAFVGTHAQAMAEAAALHTSADIVAFADVDAAGRWLSHRTPGLVYLKASRGQALEKIIDYLPQP